MFAALLLATITAPPPDLVASGVVVSSLPGRSVAVLRSGGRSRLAGVGETAFGGRVVAIGTTAVTIEFDTGRAELRLSSAGGPVIVAAPRPAADAPADPDAPSHTLAKREVERRLADEIPRILAETALTPVSDEGQVRGFALTRVPDGTLLTDAGLRAGDILTEINGIPIDSMATLIGLWPRLRNETELRAVVLRGGRPVALSVSLK